MNNDLHALTPALRLYLHVTAAITGACVLVVEILGAKMLAPYFGTSHFVWTAQIGVTLVSLSAGYYLGGRWADHSPRLGNLYLAILGAAVYLAGAMVIIERICFLCLDLKNLPVGSLLAAMFLFLIPLALLAITVPFLVRVLAVSVDRVGGQVGRLSAISTLGSVAGTALIGYVLIPRLRNSVTLLATIAVLAALAVVYYAVWGRRKPAALFVGLGLCLLFGNAGLRADKIFVPDNGRLLHRSNSPFGQILVIEHNRPIGELTNSTEAMRRYHDLHKAASVPYRMYLNDHLIQNTYDARTGQSASLFTVALYGLAHVYTPQMRDVLCIGMGVGMVPMRFANDEPKAIVDVVEINPDIIPVAEKFFGFDRRRVNLFIDDGRHFVNRTAKKYDAIVLDAFLGDSSPSHLMTVRALTAMRARLQPEGVLVVNSFGRSFDAEGLAAIQQAEAALVRLREEKRDLGVQARARSGLLMFHRPEDFLTVSLALTLRKVFGQVRIHASGNGNVFFVASRAGQLTVHHPPDFMSDDLSQNRFAGAHPVVTHDETTWRQARAMFERTWGILPARGQVLTDDYNPVEFFDAANRQRTRLSLANAMRPRKAGR